MKQRFELEIEKDGLVGKQKEISPIELSELGVPNDLKEDGGLIKKLNSLDKDKIREEISAMCDQVREQLGEGFDSDNSQVMKIIFEEIEKRFWYFNINSPKDFRKYAQNIIDVAKVSKEPNGYLSYSLIKQIIDSLYSLSRTGSNEKNSMDSLINILKNNAVQGENGDNPKDILMDLWFRAHNGLNYDETTFELLGKLAEFMPLYGEKSFCKLLDNIFGKIKISDKKDDKGKKIYEPDDVFNKWKELSKGSLVGLNDGLSIVVKSIKYDKSTTWDFFVGEFNKMTIEDQRLFIVKAQKFMQKGITPGLLMGNIDSNFSEEEFDLTKKGIDMFKSMESKQEWLKQILSDWSLNPNSVDLTQHFFDGLLVPKEIKKITKKEYNLPNIKGVSEGEMSVIEEDLNEELGYMKEGIEIIEPNKELRDFTYKLLKAEIKSLYNNKNFEIIGKIKNLIDGAEDLVQAFDREQVNKITESSLIRFIPYLGDEEKQKILPLVFDKARNMIFDNLEKDQNLADYFVENLDKYYQQPWVAENINKAISHYSVAKKFILEVEEDDGWTTKKIKDKWKGLTWVEQALVKAKISATPQYEDNNDDGYEGGYHNEGLRDFDQFEDHPWRFGDKQIKTALAISELMSGKPEDKELENLGINSQEIFPFLEEVKRITEGCYEGFLKDIQLNSKINEEDKSVLLNPKSGLVKMTPLIDSIRSLVARYLVQRHEGDIDKLNYELGNKNRQEEVVTDENDKDWSGNYPRGEVLLQDIQSLLHYGFEKYIKAYEVDIPLYDKLYEEFDNLRETGRNPLEVYLGRDGIYAYIGRRAQDVARRRKMGLEGRKKLREMGEVVEINPQYTVYPRYFRDNLDYKTKRAFLAQERITPDMDPLFYDTGYTGTIPEQIMKIMDFDSDDIEKRIRLLSAKTTGRRIKGIPKNARSEIVEYIEHNAKLDNTAVGLIKDPETGKIRPIAEPTSPLEQFEYMMIKQAIARHYWLKEKLHHEPSGNMNLDSEHYTIRIRQEYARKLPQEFINDPRSFLNTYGELLKGSKGTGEFPDEEIILFKMTDGTEIVAKKIELRKSKEARKEFSILISAKKAGLPTAEPVGFVSGKEELDGSYLLMKKIEGVSGRNFDKYLKDLGKFSEEQIKVILMVVAEKNGEMAKLFRTTLGIDKRWRIKDTIIEFNEETGEVGGVIPIDWERAENYNPSQPKEIDEIDE